MLNDIYKALKKAVEHNDHAISKWKAKLDESPAYAMEWSKDIFHAVAHNQVYKECIEGIKNIQASDKTPEEQEEIFRDYVVRQALQKASMLESSSSVTANLMNDNLRVAWSKVARYEKYGFLM